MLGMQWRMALGWFQDTELNQWILRNLNQAYIWSNCWLLKTRRWQTEMEILIRRKEWDKSKPTHMPEHRETVTIVIWTTILIPKVEPWTERRSGNCDYCISQMLIGHWSFRAYLRRIGKAKSNLWTYCEKKTTTQSTSWWSVSNGRRLEAKKLRVLLIRMSKQQRCWKAKKLGLLGEICECRTER